MHDERLLKELVARGWTHSHEEDSGDRRVFRPSERDFPPARGRESFTLKSGGTLEQVGPGPDDRSVSTAGTWSVSGDRLDLHPYGSSPRHMIVESVDSDQLIVRVLPDGP